MPFGFNKHDAQRIAKIVREGERAKKSSPPKRRHTPVVTQRIVEGKLDDDLDAYDPDEDEAPTAKLTIWSGEGEDWKETDEQVTITNRDERLELQRDDYIQAAMVSGEWRPIIAATGVEIFEGLTKEPLEAANAIDEPTTSAMWVYHKDDNDNYVREKDEDGNDVTRTLKNRDQHLTAPIGSFVIALWINGEMRPIWVSCS